ncbi:galactose mutarotase-like domain-containing protein [Pterulicium gracile]|uniref:Galactose mutarotase-like domain-containing protein n=1 Tax=Pterulicium gracile TaxID=1884261 RepID=A0A5C3Q2J2_9AGAR|nr:galactose mutarotase-like domain-containing protein [Pterula gracilis]
MRIPTLLALFSGFFASGAVAQSSAFASSTSALSNTSSTVSTSPSALPSADLRASPDPEQSLGNANDDESPRITDPNILKMRRRRMDTIIDYDTINDYWSWQFPTAQLGNWTADILSNGSWTAVNYTNGCQTPNPVTFPAAVHWRRLLAMSAAWHGGVRTADGSVDLEAEKWIGSSELRSAIEKGMWYWFDNDYQNDACMAEAGTAACPCATPGLWHMNPFANAIFMPSQASQTCLLLDDPPIAANGTHLGLSNRTKARCLQLLLRSWNAIDHGFSWAVADEFMMLVRIGVDAGLLSGDSSLLETAYQHAHDDMKPKTGDRTVGIHPDGSLLVHDGLLYNGDYGNDYINTFLDTEVLTPETSYFASPSTVSDISKLIEGSRWMLYGNRVTKKVYWDPSTMSRGFAYPEHELHANGGVNINTTAMTVLGDIWSAPEFKAFAEALSSDASKVNSGGLVGARLFHSSDYFVYRGENHVSTLKMFSSRTSNSHCTPGRNGRPGLNSLGFHLSDGLRYTYLTGHEYTDIIHVWDWNLLPGITTDYRGTPLVCNHTYYGLENFVGGVIQGSSGIAAMRYANPSTGRLKFHKAWFFLEGEREHVMVGDAWSSGANPVYSVLDQKRREGVVLVDGVDVAGKSASGSRHARPRSLWHDNIGYIFTPSAADLVVKVGEVTGDWFNISTSRDPPSTVDLFTAYIVHPSSSKGSFSPVSYTTFPAISQGDFRQRSRSRDPTGVQELRNDARVTAIYDTETSQAYAVFWTTNAGSVTFSGSQRSNFTISTNAPIAVIVDLKGGSVTVSDPSQTLKKVTLTIERRRGGVPSKLRLDFDLPLEEGKRGTAVTKSMFTK